MATITPHRDAVERGLVVMRERILGGPTKDEMERIYRELTVGLNEAALRALADARDLGIYDGSIINGVAAAVGNMQASVAETFAGGAPEPARIVLGLMAKGSFSQALYAIHEASADSMNEVVIPVDATPTGRA